MAIRIGCAKGELRSWRVHLHIEKTPRSMKEVYCYRHSPGDDGVVVVGSRGGTRISPREPMCHRVHEKAPRTYQHVHALCFPRV